WSRAAKMPLDRWPADDLNAAFTWTWGHCSDDCEDEANQPGPHCLLPLHLTMREAGFFMRPRPLYRSELLPQAPVDREPVGHACFGVCDRPDRLRCDEQPLPRGDKDRRSACDAVV